MPRATSPLRSPALAFVVLLSLPALAWARPTIRTSFFNAYPAAATSRLANLPSHGTHCGVCHYDFNGAGLKNPYGTRIGALLASYPNNDAGRQQLIHFIETEDADGDGVTQLAEITDLATYSNTPTFPGLTPANVGLAVNIPNLTEISPYLVPTTAVDTQPPVVTVTAPNGGESWVGGSAHAITWTATDNTGVNSVDLWYQDAVLEPWTALATGLANAGTWTWFVHDTPSATARVKVVARDAAGNAGADSSNAGFTITATPGGRAPTTLRDFHQRGSQPLDAGTAFETSVACVACHGGYDPAVEPGRNAMGSMMLQAARDPLFKACLAVVEQDAPGGGDLCIRCHSPIGWLSGRSQPTSGAQLNANDRDGVSCDLCHRAVNPVYQAGTSPAADFDVLARLLPAHRPTGHSNGQFVVDPDPRKRGPFADPVAPHATLESAFHRTSELCATCHDVSNPVFVRTAGADYAPDAFDTKPDSITSTTHFGLERTYSEWKHSAFPAGVYAPDFAGNRPDGTVRTCQDCHMRDVVGAGCNQPGSPTRTDLPLHDLMGGGSWMPGVIAQMWPGEVDTAALAAATLRATAMLQKAATVDVAVQSVGDSFVAAVTVTNRTGHKLPTGYPEGRRMWLHVVARDAGGATVWESGAYDAATGVLAGVGARVYETHLGMSPGLAGALGMTGGPTFHFGLNDTVYKDNRIPPAGFTNAAFATFNGQPVDDEAELPGPRYADGQHWDVAHFALPSTARSVSATLVYQSTSKEYVEFLRDENTTNTAGQTLHDLWVANGRAAPVVMASDAATFTPTAVPDPWVVRPATLRLTRNPCGTVLEAALTLPRPALVTWDVVDVQGRRLMRENRGLLGAGEHLLRWNGSDAEGRDAGAGVVWVRANIDGRVVTRQAVRLR